MPFLIIKKQSKPKLALFFWLGWKDKIVNDFPARGIATSHHFPKNLPLATFFYEKCLLELQILPIIKKTKQAKACFDFLAGLEGFEPSG